MTVIHWLQMFLANVNSGICYRPSSVVYNVCAHYSAGWNFLQCFFAIWYLCHLLTFTENFTEIVLDSQWNPLVGGFKRKRGSQNYRAIFDISKAISHKRCKIAGKLVLITDRKSYMSFRLVTESVTLNNCERRNDPYFALFFRIWYSFWGALRKRGWLEKAITMDNLRLLCLVVNVCRPRYKFLAVS